MPPANATACSAPGAAPVRLAARFGEAPDVDRGEQQERRQHRRIGEPLDLGVLRNRISARVTVPIVATACPPVARRATMRACCSPRPVLELPGRGRTRPGAVRSLPPALRPWVRRRSGAPVWAAVGYEGPARDLVGALKFRGALALADPMAALMAAAAPVRAPARGARSRAAASRAPAATRLQPGRASGARAGRRTGLPVSDCLVRGGWNLRQVGRGRSAGWPGRRGRSACAARCPRARCWWTTS